MKDINFPHRPADSAAWDAATLPGGHGGHLVSDRTTVSVLDLKPKRREAVRIGEPRRDEDHRHRVRVYSAPAGIFREDVGGAA